MGGIKKESHYLMNTMCSLIFQHARASICAAALQPTYADGFYCCLSNSYHCFCVNTGPVLVTEATCSMKKLNRLLNARLERLDAGALVQLRKFEIAGWIPTLTFKFQKKKCFFFLPLIKNIISGSLRDREVASSASDRQGSNLKSCVRRAVSSHSSQSSGGFPGPVSPICAQR